MTGLFSSRSALTVLNNWDCSWRIEPSFIEYDGDDPIAFVVSVNIKRRQLSPSQLACVAVWTRTDVCGGGGETDAAQASGFC
jgi:hypothetical protein